MVREKINLPPNGAAAAIVVGAVLAWLLIAIEPAAWVGTVLLSALLFAPFAGIPRWHPTLASHAGQDVAYQFARLAFCIALVGFQVHLLFSVMAQNVATVPEWDFPVLWVHAHMAASGMDFYDTSLVQKVAATFHPSPSFLSQGRFWNPPQTMLLLLPLGWFDDIRRAYSCWYVLQSLTLCGCVLLLWRKFAPASGVAGLALTAALTTTLEPTLTTFVVGQTNFLVLFLMLLTWQQRRTPFGGVWLCLGTLFKPLLLILLIEFVMRRRTAAIGGLAVSMLLMSMFSTLVFGPDLFLGYFQHGAGEVPVALYRQPANQSLLAVLLRSNIGIAEGIPPLAQPLYLLLALSVLGGTAWLIHKLGDDDEALSLSLLTLAALLCYPQTLDHYGVLLLVPIMALWKTQKPSALAGCVGIVALCSPLVSENPELFAADIFAALAIVAAVQPWKRFRPELVSGQAC